MSARLGIRIVDVSDEGAAVHMAHAHAELTGALGVAMVTAGPGVTNTVTGMANASLARMPVLLIGGCTSRPQANMGPLQDIPHVDILRPVTRMSRTAQRRRPGRARTGRGRRPAPWATWASRGRSIWRSRPTCCARTCRHNLVLDGLDAAQAAARSCRPSQAAVDDAVEALWSAQRPLVITGRGARGAAAELVRLLDATGACLSRYPGKPRPGAGRPSGASWAPCGRRR